MYEMALVSASTAKLETMSQSGSSRASRVLSILKEPEKMLSTIQVGITLIGIISGAYGGIALSASVVPLFNSISILAPYAQDLAFITVVGAITYLSLVIGELVPKSIALSSPERIAITLSPVMSGVTIVVYPFVWILTSSTKIINRILGIKTNETRFMTEEEIRQIIKQSSEQGVIDEDETQMIKEVFRFGETRVHELMTHRKKISYIELSDSINQIIDKIETENHSKYLLCKEDIENVIGTIAVKDLLKIVYKGHISSADLTEVAKSPLYLPENLTAQKALELFRENKKNFGIVISEYGGVEGILTLHDLTETILGEIPEESEEANDIITKREDGSMLVNGSMHINDFMEAMNIVKFDDIEESGFNTMGGMAMHLLGKVPSETDKFTYNGFQFEVIDMDGSRVDKLLVTRATEID